MPSRGTGRDVASIPVGLFLDGYPAPMREIAERLRAIVKRATPQAIERVRIGWQLVGYDLPIDRRRTTFFAWVWIQPEHVHLGFTRGSLLDDRALGLEGIGVTKYARWLTFAPGDPIDEEWTAEIVGEAARTAALPRSSPWTIRSRGAVDSQARQERAHLPPAR